MRRWHQVPEVFLAYPLAAVDLCSDAIQCGRHDEKYGFIGLGQMGFHMANNLYRRSGRPLVVYDVSPAAIKRFLGSNQSGAEIHVASSPREVAEHCTFLATMLPESEHVKEAYLGKNGILSGVKPGTLCVDSSTIDPVESVQVIKEIAKCKAIGADGPVSGG
ncbi:hypothetical protein EV182_003184, partial [Spiromyces aspiralis]